MDGDGTAGSKLVKGGAIWVLAAALYMGLASATIRLTSDGNAIATIWPANAVLLALLITQRQPRWWTVLSAGFIGNLAANLITRGSVVGPVIYSIANIIEVVVAARLLAGRSRNEGLLHSAQAVGRFFLIAGVIAPAISSAIGAAAATLFFDQPYAEAFTTWLLSDGLGLTLFTPFLAATFSGDFARSFFSRTWRSRMEVVALLLLTAAIAAAVFLLGRQPVLFLVFPPVMLITFRVGRLGTKAAIMIIALIGAIATMMGQGPVAALSSDPVFQAQWFQGFLAVVLLTCLPVAAEVSARSRLADDLAARERDMAEKAVTDGLTGCLNRAGFEEAIVPVLKSGAKGCLITIDVDRFKTINDTWGHAAGDQALRRVATALRAQIRAADLFGRLGGDEFTIFLPGSDPAQASIVCNRARDALNRIAQAANADDFSIQISCGIADARHGESFEDLARRSDQALYRAKAAGRNASQCA